MEQGEYISGPLGLGVIPETTETRGLSGLGVNDIGIAAILDSNGHKTMPG